MNNYFVLILTLLLSNHISALAPYTPQDTTSETEATLITEARAMIQKMIQEENIVGLAISVSHADRLIWSEGFGYSDLNKETHITPDKTHFRIASISKPITATIMGRLYEEQFIDFDESVYRYVPDFPKKKYDFTIRHLASHRSGIRHYKWYEKENKKPLSIEEGLKKFKKSKLKLKSKPGSAYLYSSYGYNLLGVAMEKAAQKPFEELLRSYVTEPLGMDHTIPDDGINEGILTSGFFQRKKKGKAKEAKAVNLFMKLPCGGMLSTSEDLVRFGNAYIYQRILKKETQEELLANTPLPNGKKVGYGMGWGIATDKEGRKIISHTGGNTGSVCRLIVYPKEKLVVAVVSNTFGIDYLKFIRTVRTISTNFLDTIEESQ